ncbi:septum site-determining protein MinC [Clostridium perfringens]|uniref:septum site-determining protein MinC n=1 Tax=Clostridium perfringens TaxID=1502 RepID=UPI001CCE06DB|nr:septum site-determining protein MinC [Clostridium perfringens]EJT6163674.1 septum site-determining protein MinC [Clostridium perfringens]EJT6655138.1 septum site-determining protein MinC [Clostridium perfringens]MDK0703009.1 septum site-determining protein MinC [Clostridium perfringens]MDK0785986.1 septum site-determining protein MinC [Clostridium perfringens]UBK28564.1 septum site-determining protein MinC [Clostridium perfringens]
MRDDRIFIKGNKLGINAIINMDKFGNFDEMLDSLVEKLSRGKKFYKGATLTVTTDLKYINERQISKLKDVLFDEILIKDCIFEERLEKQSSVFSGVYEGRTKFVRKTVRSGQCLNYAGNLIIIGDVNNGGEVRAHGNVIVLGDLKGKVFAGDNGNENAIIAAYSLEPELISISGKITISPDDFEKTGYPEVARLNANNIIVEPYLPDKYSY